MPNRPSGTVTFLFTDIDSGSTTSQQAGVGDAVSRQKALVREAIEANGGYAYKVVGGGFQAAFPTAPQAVQAALDAQRILQSAEWGGSEIRVKMALHTGVTEEREGDYVGPLLNRVARLMAAGHGGQVLLTLATAELARDQLPTGAALRDMGEHRLKDLTRPERIYQLVAQGIASEFPPLRTLDIRPNNLPAQPTPLIGRDQEAVAIGELLGSAGIQLLTLTGAGGIGKTRLAMQVGADLIDSFSDGVFFVGFAALADPALVIPTIAQTLGLRDQSGLPLDALLREHLRDKHMLLVLDNLEHLPEAAPQIAELAAAAPGVKMLATSRAPLHLSMEREYPVPPLSLPDPKHLPVPEALSQYQAVELFISRARSVDPSFEVTNANAPAVAEICYRLDGLPLAIELAAARTKILTPEAMLARLGSSLKLLTGGALDLPPRQRTLRGAIEWSHNLLEPSVQQLFRRLAVFSGGCTLEAAEEVCGSDLDVDVLDGVSSLVDESLMYQREHSDGQMRFFMLETIHEYAWEQLRESGEEAEYRERHARYFLALVEDAEPQLTTSAQAEWIRRLDDEHDNIRATLRWALDQDTREGVEIALRTGGALWRYWYMRGLMSEARRWLHEALSAPHSATLPPEVRARALNGSGNLAYAQGEMAVARRDHEESLALRRALGDKLGIAASLSNIANIVADENDLSTAYGIYQESLHLLRELGDTYKVATSLSNLGLIAYQQSKYRDAECYHDEALQIKRELGDTWGVASILSIMGLAAMEQGRLDEAEQLLQESLRMQRELGDKTGTASSIHNLGALAYSRGDYATARACYEESLQMKKETGDRHGITTSLAGLGTLRLEEGDYEGAIALHEQSLEIKREIGDKEGIGNSLLNLGKVAMDRGRYEEACSLFSEGLALLREWGDLRGTAWCLVGLAGAAAALGQPQRAARILGAESVVRKEAGYQPHFQDIARYEQYMADARSRLDDARWEAAWAEGEAMNLEEVVEYALSGEVE